MLFNHREPLFPLPIQLAFSFQVYAALPFFSLSGDPGEQAAKQNHRGHPPCYASHLGGQDSESQPVMLHFPQRDPGIRKRKAELRTCPPLPQCWGPLSYYGFALFLPFHCFHLSGNFTLQQASQCCFTMGIINILAIAALGQDGSQEMDFVGCVEHSWKGGKQHRRADLAAMMKTKGV